MKTLSLLMSGLLLAGLVFFSVSCKDDEPKKRSKCSFTFKNQNYTSNSIACSNDNDVHFLTSPAPNMQQDWYLYISTNGSIGLDFFGSSTKNYSASNGTVTYSNDSFTFSGTLLETTDPHDTGMISGKCSCAQ